MQHGRDKRFTFNRLSTVAALKRGGIAGIMGYLDSLNAIPAPKKRHGEPRDSVKRKQVKVTPKKEKISSEQFKRIDRLFSSRLVGV